MQITYHIPVFGSAANSHLYDPHPNAIFDIFEAHGLGKVRKVDVVPRNGTISSMDWMSSGQQRHGSQGMLAFVHCEGAMDEDASGEDASGEIYINPQVLRAIDNPSIEFRIDWEQYLGGTGESYWIITRSTSTTPPTAACATYERELFSGHMTVILRSYPIESDASGSPVTTRCALYGCGISSGEGVCLAGNDPSVRYDLEHGKQCFLEPRSSLTGDVGYYLNEFIAWYGYQEGSARFEFAPIAAASAPLVLNPSVSGELTISELSPELADDLARCLAPPLNCLQGEGGVARCYVHSDDPSVVIVMVNVRSSSPTPALDGSYELVVHRAARARRIRGIVWSIHSILDDMCAPGIFRLGWHDELFPHPNCEPERYYPDPLSSLSPPGVAP